MRKLTSRDIAKHKAIERGIKNRVSAKLSAENDEGCNRHPADRLAEVRAAIAELKAEEKILRDGFLDEEADLVGDEYEVYVQEVNSERLDRKKAEKLLTKDIIRQISSTTCTMFVKVRKRKAKYVIDEDDADVWS